MYQYRDEDGGRRDQYYNVNDMDDDEQENFAGREMGESDTQDQYNHGLGNGTPNTSSTQGKRGRDIQDIPWHKLTITREYYRKSRLKKYKNYENVPFSGEVSGKGCKLAKKGAAYYDFLQNTMSVKSTILHFQLRNLVWSTTKHDVYLMSHSSVIHWSALTHKKSEVLNVAGHVAPTEKHPGSLREGFTHTLVSTLAVKDNLVVLGGFEGELICKPLNRKGVAFCCRSAYDDNAIINAVDIYESCSGAAHFMASSNDCGVQDFNLENFQLCKHFSFPWSVNHTSLNPDGKLLLVVGDDPDGMVVDSQTGEPVAILRGHLDFSFASAWHPDGHSFATGNQDKTCCIWDVRNMSKAVTVLKGNVGAIRSIRFTSDGRFMAMAEPADFVHIYDVNNAYEREQEIDFFGEISGISFSPDTTSLFIGVWDRTYGSFLQFGRRLSYTYLDTLQ